MSAPLSTARARMFRQASTERVPINRAISHSDIRGCSSFAPAFIVRARTMKIVFTSRLSRSSQAPERKATFPLRPVSEPPTKSPAGKRF
jgi:hypothetical protein